MPRGRPKGSKNKSKAGNFSRCCNPSCPTYNKDADYVWGFTQQATGLKFIVCRLCYYPTTVGATAAKLHDYRGDAAWDYRPGTQEIYNGGTLLHKTNYPFSTMKSGATTIVSTATNSQTGAPTVSGTQTMYSRCETVGCPNHTKDIQSIHVKDSSTNQKWFICPACFSLTAAGSDQDFYDVSNNPAADYRYSTREYIVAGNVMTPKAVGVTATVTVSAPVVPEEPVKERVYKVDLKSVRSGLLGYEHIDKAATLAVIAGEHFLLGGKPGMAKSLFYRKFFNNFQGDFFETQLSKFSDDSALFGAPDLKKMRETGDIVYPQRGIAAAHWVGIDEIMDGSDICLRTLNPILNERKMLRGNSIYDIPLQTCIATCNYTRTNEIIAAVIDRFALSGVSPLLTEEQRIKLYDGVDFEAMPEGEKIPLEAIHEVRDIAKKVKIPETLVKTLVRWATEQGFSPRRERVMAKMLKVNAALEGRKEINEKDLQVIKWILPLSATLNPNQDDPSKELRDGIMKALREAEQIKMIDSFRNVKKADGDRKLTYAKNLASAIRQIRDIMPVSDQVGQYKDSILQNLQEVHTGIVREEGLLV
jgi:MoxR-like ATPase